MFYQIKEKLTECREEDLSNPDFPYVANVTMEEFMQNKNMFDLNMDLDLKIIQVTHAKNNENSLTGCICIPDRVSPDEQNDTFGFAMDERGIVFIDEKGIVNTFLSKIQKQNKWKKPSMERFLYDFLNQIIDSDLDCLEDYEQEMNGMVEKIFDEDYDNLLERLAEIRRLLIVLTRHYERLVNLSDKFQDNDYEFFDEDNLRYFQLFSERVGRLQQNIASLREHILQIHDLYHAKLDERQNTNMAVLTVIATAFTPITILTGWYGMNFAHMPELNSPLAYPIMVCVCVGIIVGSLIYFKKKKWF